MKTHNVSTNHSHLLNSPSHSIYIAMVTLLAGMIAAWPADLRAADNIPVPKPNVLIILADDLGRGDYSAFGTKDIQTPNVDRLCKEGMTFENFFANSCVCSPSRASLMTGMYPDRAGVPGLVRDIPEDSWGYLRPDAKLLPQALKPAGYHTAIVGKWNLGLETPNLPNERGFDLFHGFLDDMMDDYWTHLRNGKNFLRLNEQPVNPEGHATDIFTSWACDYLRDRAKTGGRFFLYLAYNAPHAPIQPPKEWLDKVHAREPQLNEKRAKIVALIEHLDAGIGKVLATLDETGLATNTLVILNSDNGGRLEDGAYNGPWRSGKTHMYEGGLRVPCVVRWPGNVKPGSQAKRYTLTMDIYPTICQAAGVAWPEKIDGVSFLPTLLEVDDSSPKRDLYFVRRDGNSTMEGKSIDAFRRGDWKLLQDSPFAPLELYNLENDPTESTNLAGTQRKIFNQLSAGLRKQIQIGGKTPWQPPE